MKAAVNLFEDGKQQFAHTIEGLLPGVCQRKNEVGVIVAGGMLQFWMVLTPAEARSWAAELVKCASEAEESGS